MWKPSLDRTTELLSLVATLREISKSRKFLSLMILYKNWKNLAGTVIRDRSEAWSVTHRTVSNKQQRLWLQLLPWSTRAGLFSLIPRNDPSLPAGTSFHGVFSKVYKKGRGRRTTEEPLWTEKLNLYKQVQFLLLRNLMRVLWKWNRYWTLCTSSSHLKAIEMTSHWSNKGRVHLNDLQYWWFG